MVLDYGSQASRMLDI